MNESKLIIEIQDDGTVKVNAQKVKGSSDAIMKQLQDLAAEVGGELTIEKHVETHHHHDHDHSHDHEKH